MDVGFIFDIDNYFSDDDDFELDVSTTAYLIDIPKKIRQFAGIFTDLEF